MKVYHVIERNRCHQSRIHISGDGYNIQLFAGQVAGRTNTYIEQKNEFFHQLSAKFPDLTRLGSLHFLGLQD